MMIRRFAALSLPVALAIALLLQPGAQAGSPDTSSVSAATTGAGQQPTLPDLLSKAAANVAALADDTRILYGEEQYEHTFLKVKITGDGRIERAPNGSKAWVAELAVVATPQEESRGYPWVEFRDIVTMDGNPLRNGTSRLGVLATVSWNTSGPAALKITNESAGYRLGRFERGATLPRIPTLFLHAANQGRFEFKKAREHKIGDIKTWEIRYQEKSKPTIFRAPGDKDAPASGWFRIDPATGQVMMSLLKNGDHSALFSELTTTYTLDQATGLWLPSGMVEKSVDEEEQTNVDGKATYGKWRFVEKKGK